MFILNKVIEVSLNSSNLSRDFTAKHMAFAPVVAIPGRQPSTEQLALKPRPRNIRGRVGSGTAGQWRGGTCGGVPRRVRYFTASGVVNCMI